MTTKDAIKHLSYKIFFCKGFGRMRVDGVNVDALEIAARAMAEERKKGYWEYVDDVDYRCSICHKYAYGCLGEVLSGHYKYCPYCGCAMEGEEDDDPR